jgi:RNA polymerase-binding transcription factor DksA
MKKKAKKISKSKKPAKIPAKTKAPAKAKALTARKAPKIAVPPTPPVEQPATKLKLPKADALKYKKLLLDLRDHLIDGVNFLASDNLKRSGREASGELSGYSLHMADAGTDNFDREFALSLVSSEQDALYEIEEAMKRLEAGTYGVCAMCDKLIRKERLEAVPFTRMCVQCQSVEEKNPRRPAPVTGIFNEKDDESGDEKEESEE